MQLFVNSDLSKGRFPLSRNFYVRTRVNKIEAMYEKGHVNLKLESRWISTDK